MTTFADRIDGIETSVAIKAPVGVATTANIVLSGTQTIDGVVLATGDRVLVKDQTDTTENGIWNVASGAWSRATDFNGTRDAVRGTEVYVAQGTTNGNRRYAVTTTNPVIGSTAISFIEIGQTTIVGFGEPLRNAANAGSIATALADGEVGVMGGLFYQKDSTAVGALSATNDLSVDGLVAFGGYDLGHFGDLVEGSDVSQIMDRAITAALRDRNAMLTCRRGRYLLNSLVDVEFPSSGSGSPVHMATLDFAGCVFEVPASNTTGGIKITKHNNFQQLRIRNLEIQSAALIGVDADPTNGVGLHLYSALRPGDAGWGTTEAKELVLENVHVVSKAPGTLGRWDEGIRIDGFWFPELRGVWVTSRHPGTDADTTYESGDGIAIWNCYSPLLTSCYSLGRFMHNIRIDEDEDFGYEDFQVTGCYGVGGRDALAVRMSSASMQAAGTKEPGGRISGGHFNGHRRAISIEYRRQFSIDGPLLYTTIGSGNSDYAAAAFVYLNDCKDATITVNVPEGGHYTSDADCTRHIHLEGDTDFIKIKGCEFGADGIAIANTSSGTSNVAEGNVFESSSGSPTKQIVDASNLLKGGDAYTPVTPIVEFGGANTGMTFSSQDGGYTQLGRIVSFWIDVRLSAKGSSTGNANIVASLPAPVSGSDFGITRAYTSGAGTQAALGGIVASNGQIELYHENASENLNQRITNADFDNSTEIRISGSYIAA